MSNCIQFTGIIGQKIQHKILFSGNPMVFFQLGECKGTNYYQSEDNYVQVWHDVVGFADIARKCVTEFSSGQYVLITGKLRCSHYVDLNERHKRPPQVVLYAIEPMAMPVKDFAHYMQRFSSTM